MSYGCSLDPCSIKNQKRPTPEPRMAMRQRKTAKQRGRKMARLGTRTARWLIRTARWLTRRARVRRTAKLVTKQTAKRPTRPLRAARSEQK